MEKTPFETPIPSTSHALAQVYAPPTQPPDGGGRAYVVFRRRLLVSIRLAARTQWHRILFVQLFCRRRVLGQEPCSDQA